MEADEGGFAFDYVIKGFVVHTAYSDFYAVLRGKDHHSDIFIDGFYFVQCLNAVHCILFNTIQMVIEDDHIRIAA